MTAVLVNLADLETIIFATGAIKNIEAALANRRNDPFVRPHLDYTEAHDRLATAMRQASRAEALAIVIEYHTTVLCNCGGVHPSFEHWQKCPMALVPRTV